MLRRAYQSARPQGLTAALSVPSFMEVVGARDEEGWQVALEPHPMRAEIVREMHLRPSLAVAPPAQIVQSVLFIPDRDFSIVRAHAAGLGFAIADTARHAILVKDDVVWLYEQHTEAITLTALLPAGIGDRQKAAAVEQLESFPGTVLRAIRIDVLPKHHHSAEAAAAKPLRDPEIVGGCVDGICFRSNFRLDHEDGYGRLVVIAPAEVHAADLGRVLQALQELGNYRNLALLGLALVREVSAELENGEATVGAIIEEISGGGDDRHELDRLLRLAASVARLRARSAYRLRATAAYGRIVSERLAWLDPQPIPGMQTLGEFTNRRVLPALRTCENFSDRLEALALEIEQATGLLRARIETGLAVQNADLLRGLDATAKRQLRLQHLVEGLSVFAVSYYAIGLIGYLLQGFASIGIADAHHIQGMLAMPVVVLILLFLMWQKRRPH